MSMKQHTSGAFNDIKIDQAKFGNTYSIAQQDTLYTNNTTKVQNTEQLIPKYRIAHKKENMKTRRGTSK